MRKSVLFSASVAALTGLLLTGTSFAFVNDWQQIPGGDYTSNPEIYYSTKDQVVDPNAVLPDPPTVGSPRFQLDVMTYWEARKLRNTPRGEQARKDAVWDDIPASFSEAFGCELSPENTPRLFSMLKHMSREGALAVRHAKVVHFRTRPFVYFEDSTCYPKDEESLRKNGSYPSAHTSCAWNIGLLLAELNPARGEQIMRRAWEIGQSRVICGCHWQSDVDAARNASSIYMAGLRANPRFQAALAEVKAEVAQLKAEGKLAK